MNWGFICWVIGIVLTMYVLKFAIMAMRSLFSKESMESMLKITGKKVTKAKKSMEKKIKQAVEKRNAEMKARANEEEEPVVVHGTVR